MRLTGLHLLLTYECNLECDHCFVWGGPGQSGTMTAAVLEEILKQAADAGPIEWIYFEGGEPFLYYALLRRGVRRATELGFKVGLVSNAYWATSPEDASEWLRDLTGSVQDLALSQDPYHGEEDQARRVGNACRAARERGIPADVIRISVPEAAGGSAALGQLPAGESAVMYRGRAAVKLAGRASPRPWAEFTACPSEDLREPGRVHVDPFGNLHLCQGIVLGNLLQRPLKEICASYDPNAHPIAGPLLAGGPAELARGHRLPLAEGYADACHLCYEARSALRPRYPGILAPAQMYGSPAGG
jgi:MoaA/NifB/PqqE/SkfB family radical SAM enzyme